ncbi:sugar nucleotide-binding protein [Pseudomonas aeruginosa]
MRLMLLGGGNALGQALIRLGAEGRHRFPAPRPPEQGWDAASLTTLLDETRPDAVINLAFYHDWFQAEQVEAERLGAQERAVERLAELCQHYEILLVQPSSYRGLRRRPRHRLQREGRDPSAGPAWPGALARWSRAVRAACPRHVLIRFGWLLDESPNGLLGRFPQPRRTTAAAVPHRRPSRQT